MSKNEIAQMIIELRPLLTGGRVQKIYQASEKEITVVIRSSETHMLYFSLDPEFSRVHLVAKKRKSPLNPFAFCQFLRKHLIGTAVFSIAQAVDDRVISLAFRGAEGDLYLVAELFGRKSNLFITNVQGKVLNTLIKNGKDDREEVIHPLDKPKAGTEEPACFPKKHLPIGTPELSLQAEASYEENEERRAHENLQRKILSDLKKRAGKLQVRREKMKGDLASLEKWKNYLKFGELLKNNLHLVEKGSTEVELFDYESGEKRLVPLTASLSSLENMNNYFSRYKKSTRGHKKIIVLLQEAERESLVIEEKIKFVENATPEMLSKAYNADKSPGREKSTFHKKKTSKPHNFTSFDGLSILVGKSDTQNDEITFKIAKGNDLWFHVRGGGGAHVLLQVDKKTAPQQESILDAASLALFYSKIKDENRGEVLYTHRKYLKKIKGDKPGRVTYARDKTIYVHIEGTRIRRLMDSKLATA